ncbi:MAG TPA: o-succinylbenzoate synthase, partial [Pseudonocardiaceae bacterium]
MKLTGFELRRISIPLVSPFRTSFAVETGRDVLLVRAVTTDAEGWGECVALSDPLYSSEYVDGAADVLRRFLIPALAAADRLDAGRVAQVLAPFKGHRMAKCALEAALLDAELRAEGRPLGRELGAVRDRVPCGVSVGIMDSIPALLEAVAGYLDAGYVRIKL